MLHARNISISKREEEKQFARPRRYHMVKSIYSEDVGYVHKPAASYFVKSFVMHKVVKVNLHLTILYSNYCSGSHCFFFYE